MLVVADRKMFVTCIRRIGSSASSASSASSISSISVNVNANANVNAIIRFYSNGPPVTTSGFRETNTKVEMEEMREKKKNAFKWTNLAYDLEERPTYMYVPEDVKKDLKMLHDFDPSGKYSVPNLALRFKLSTERVKVILAMKALEMAKFKQDNATSMTEEEQMKDAKGLAWKQDLKVRESENFQFLPDSKKMYIEPSDGGEAQEKIDTMVKMVTYLGDHDEENVPIQTRTNAAEKVYASSEQYYVVRSRQQKAMEAQESLVSVNTTTDDNVTTEEEKKVIDKDAKKMEANLKDLPAFLGFPTEERVKNKWKIAIKDLSVDAKTAPLLIRDEFGVLRIATPDEASSRSWVKKPKAINVLMKTSKMVGFLETAKTIASDENSILESIGEIRQEPPTTTPTPTTP